MKRIGSEFMERTAYGRLGPSAQQRAEPQPPLQILLADGPEVALPPVEGLSGGLTGLREAIADRRSIRQYGPGSLSIEEMSLLLWATQGVREARDTRATFRTVPSAGARHPLETVVLANRVDGLPRGFHQYDALRHRLIGLESPQDAAERLTAACLGQGIVQSSAATLVWIADIARMTWRYGERGYRYVHLDAGHVCQNLYLIVGSIGAGACAVGAFDDGQLNALLGLDGHARFAVYAATVGKLPA